MLLIRVCQWIKLRIQLMTKDVALNSIRVMNNRYDLTHNFENVVYNELLYMGYNLQVYHDGAQEIDFQDALRFLFPHKSLSFPAAALLP